MGIATIRERRGVSSRLVNTGGSPRPVFDEHTKAVTIACTSNGACRQSHSCKRMVKHANISYN
jgi:hypothetical protein